MFVNGLYNVANFNTYKNNYNQRKVSFKGLSSVQSVLQKSQSRMEYPLRVFANKVSDFFQPKAAKEITKSISEIVPEQNAVYLAQLAEIGRMQGTQKVFEVNTEDGILEQIAQKGDSAIFIMNHSSQNEDPQMLGALNTMLATAYEEAGAQNTFPLPKVIMNEDILNAMNPIKRKAYENMGSVGIDASLEGANKGLNARAFLPLVKDFVRNKCNIFIFPEGRLAVRKDLDFQDRFQSGVSSLINKILDIKKSVTVVPVGFAYGRGEIDKNAMQIGTPLVLKRDGKSTSVTKGDIEKDKNSDLYNFCDKHKSVEDITITDCGKPVEKSEIVDYLDTFLCENLRINSEIANQKLSNPYNLEDVIGC